MQEAMRIQSLRLVNFAPIFYSLDQEDLFLDLSKSNKTINLIIGKMGSCKTVILGHLQPFSDFGSLDIRNRDDMILPEKNGLKEIIYEKDGSLYVIHHSYTWNKNGETHNTKSFIAKDGVELNENGNRSSFLEIVQMELEIEPNYLRILRLGANVGNVISMKATERKGFFASLLKDSNFYLMIHKKLSDDLRKVNAQIGVLSNKLHHYGVDKVKEMEEEVRALNELVMDYTDKIRSIADEMTTLNTLNQVQLKSMTMEEFIQETTDRVTQFRDLSDHAKEIDEQRLAFEGYPEIHEVSKQIGSLDAEIETRTKKIEELSNSYRSMKDEVFAIDSKIGMIGSVEHIDNLKNMYHDLLEKVSSYQKELEHFTCKHSAQTINTLMGDLNGINGMIYDISQYDAALIHRCFNHPGARKWAEKEMNICMGRRHKLQVEMSNLKFSAEYTPTQCMYTPPFCPTDECPYKRTHPYTIQKSLGKKKKDMDENLRVTLSQIESIDIEMNKLSDVPYISTRIQVLQENWAKVLPILKDLRALKTHDLYKILTDRSMQVWYDQDRLSRMIELSEKRTKFYELTEQMTSVKNELNLMELNDVQTLLEKKEELGRKIGDFYVELDHEQEELDRAKEDLINANDLYLQLSQKDVIERECETILTRLKSLEAEIKERHLSMDMVKERDADISRLGRERIEWEHRSKSAMDSIQKTQTILNDIDYTSKEYDELMKERRVLSLLVRASSSKEGIPLKLVQIFMNSCRDTINELISNVFNDRIEILDFDIRENEFKIPCLVNGSRIDDIEKVSQGQTAIISIALSFALIRQAGMGYNIMLLDEIDAPLYKDDREKFIMILTKQLSAIGASQVFLISHNNTFEGYPVMIIMTTEENTPKTPINELLPLYSNIA